jgi:hypothetical protein
MSLLAHYFFNIFQKILMTASIYTLKQNQKGKEKYNKK